MLLLENMPTLNGVLFNKRLWNLPKLKSIGTVVSPLKESFTAEALAISSHAFWSLWTTNDGL